MNPMSLLTLKSSLELFKNNHPRFIQFVNSITQAGIKEGTVLECKIITPEGKEVQTNIKLNKDDIQFIEQIKSISEEK